MGFHHISERTARTLAAVFLATSILLGTALGASWAWFSHLALKPATTEAPAARAAIEQAPVSPLLLRYQLTVPGRGEIFPALATGSAADYWPLALLSIANQSDRPVLEAVSTTIPGWSRTAEQTVVIGPHENRVLHLAPDLLPEAMGNDEIRRATLQVRVTNADGDTVFAQDRPVYMHAASDLYWGKQFSNAQFVARWVTPHDAAVLRLVGEARNAARNERMPGYNMTRPNPRALSAQVRDQANAVFQALRRSGLSYVSSIYTFGNFTSEAQRIRLPRETLTLNNANCIDVSVAFASAMENLGMKPVVVVVPGHAFVGVRLGPDTLDTLYLDLTVLPRGSFDAAVARAQSWLKKTPPNEVLTVDVSAARLMGIYPLPTQGGPQEAI